MAKFCSKCGTKLNEKTGKCPNCDEKTKMDLSNSDGANSTNVNSKNDETMKKNSGEQKKENEKNSSNHHCGYCGTNTDCCGNYWFGAISAKNSKCF